MFDEYRTFSDRFEAQLHNKYLRAKSDIQEKINAESFHKVLSHLKTIVISKKNI